MWIHNKSGKKYVGSSLNLGRRLGSYFNKSSLIKSKTMRICRSLLKYGYSEFTLVILEYVNGQPLSELIARENFYIQKYNPQLNVLKVAGIPPIPVYTAQMRRRLSKNHKSSQTVLVIDFFLNKTFNFHSINEASRKLGIFAPIISNYINMQKYWGYLNLKINDRYAIFPIGKPLQQSFLHSKLSKKVIVIDTINGNKQTSYPSLGAFARTIRRSRSIVARFISRNLASGLYTNSTKLPKLFLSRYFILLPTEENSRLIKGSDSFYLNPLIKVTNLNTGNTTNYFSITQAANALAISRKYLLEYLFLTGENKPILGKYIITYIGKYNKYQLINPKKFPLRGNPYTIEITNIDSSEKLVFSSLAEAARNLGVRFISLKSNLNGKRSKFFKGKYIIHKISSSGSVISKDYLVGDNLSATVGKQVEVKNTVTNEIHLFSSIKDAAKFIGCDVSHAAKWAKGKYIKPIKDKFTVNLIAAPNEQSSGAGGGYALLERTTNKPKLNQVEVTNLETKEVKIYPFVKDAAEAIGCDPSNLGKHLKGKFKTMKGKYVCKYVGLEIRSNVPTGVEITNIETNKVDIFPTLSSAAKYLGNSSASALSAYFRDKRTKPFKGKYLLRKIES